MIDAYVDGRPMPRSSSALTRLASVYRAGGLVSWPCGSRLDACSAWPTVSARQPPLLVLLARLVAARLVRLQEARERDDRAARAEGRGPLVGRRRAELDRDRLAARVLHLRRDRPLEDQVVERVLVARQLAAQLVGRAEDVACRADRLVRLLRVRDRTLVAPRLRGDGLLAVRASRVRARRLQRGVGERDRVRAHVRDVAVLVEPLRDAHRRLRREAELAARLLLQRRRAERCRGPPRVRLLVDLLDGERPAFEPAASAARPSSSSTRTRPTPSTRPRAKSRPCAMRLPSTARAAPRRTRARTCRGCPSRTPRRIACARARDRRRGASRPTARVPPRAAA